MVTITNPVLGIVEQLGPLLSSNPRLVERPPQGWMRGVDYYSDADFTSALLTAAKLFHDAHGYVPSLISPSAFSEHLVVRKFFAALPMPSLGDKLGVRDYVRARAGDDVLTSVVWTGRSVQDLFAAELPSGRFVLKANHGWGFNLILTLPDDLSRRRAEIETKAGQWLATSYGENWGEWHYCTFERRLFLERFLDFNGDNVPEDYKILCFHGKARVIEIHAKQDGKHKIGFFGRLGRQFAVTKFNTSLLNREPPKNLGDLIAVAEAIAKDLEFARVDLYTDEKHTIKFGEVTFVPSNANRPYSDVRFDKWLGQFFDPATANQPS
jgi:hypothetical protein